MADVVISSTEAEALAASAAFEDAAGEPTGGGCGGQCGCGGGSEPDLPELDARTIPHALRHASILGALAGLPVAGGLVLVAPHDPLPLLAQIDQRWPSVFTVDYLQRGPEAWRLALVRSV